MNLNILLTNFVKVAIVDKLRNDSVKENICTSQLENSKKCLPAILTDDNNDLDPVCGTADHSRVNSTEI